MSFASVTILNLSLPRICRFLPSISTSRQSQPHIYEPHIHLRQLTSPHLLQTPQAKRALKSVLSNTLNTSALEPLLQVSTPPNILKYVIAQFSKILPHDVSARRGFVTSGCLARVQEIASLYAAGPISSLSNGAEPETGDNQFLGSKLAEYIRVINECYPEEIVRYYSPGYSTTLLSKIDEYSGGQAGSQQQLAPRELNGDVGQGRSGLSQKDISTISEQENGEAVV